MRAKWRSVNPLPRRRWSKIIQLLHRQNQPAIGIHKEEHSDRDVHCQHDEGDNGRVRIHLVGKQHLQAKGKRRTD